MLKYIVANEVKFMKLALFGVPGNMGSEVFKTVVKEDYIEEISLLVFNKKGLGSLLNFAKKHNKKVRVVYGSVADIEKVREAIKGVDYVVNMAAVIPPESDKYPLRAIEANEIGPKVIVQAIEELGDKQPKFIHTSTIGIYGDRNHNHPFAEVGDPLLLSPFDLYAVTKMRGEFTVLESNVKTWAIIRQAAMLYDKLLMKNVSDGLLFHTCFNTPLEWSTAKDSAVLVRNIFRRDLKGELNETNFWKHCFNIGGGVESRVTGYDTFKMGFGIIGCKVEQFFDTNYNSMRNFHGEWYSDGYKLNDLFNYQEDTIQGFWDNVLDTHKYFKLAGILPKKFLKAVVIKRLLNNPNSPYHWYKHKDEARMLAYFDGSEKYRNIDKDWENFNLLSNGVYPNGETFDFKKYRETVTRLDHYFDIDKPLTEVTIEDLRNYAEARGGKLITEDYKTGEVYRQLEWETADKERFTARPYSLLFCGHWMNISYKEYAWDFDRIAKVDKLAAQIWYDSHSKDEDRFYYYDENFNAHYKNL